MDRSQLVELPVCHVGDGRITRGKKTTDTGSTWQINYQNGAGSFVHPCKEGVCLLSS